MSLKISKISLKIDKKFWGALIICLPLVFLGAGCGSEDTTPELNNMDNQPVTELPSFPGVLPNEEIENKHVRVKTEKGDIVFELFADTAPKTVSNFVSLANKDYFDGLTFHRREEGFVIQGGDPNGNGTGGPGYTFADELTDDYSYERGIVAMANRGPNTNGSQFFIMLADVPLPKLYTIFGHVTEGMDVVDRIEIGEAMTEVLVEEK